MEKWTPEQLARLETLTEGLNERLLDRAERGLARERAARERDDRRRRRLRRLTLGLLGRE